MRHFFFFSLLLLLAPVAAAQETYAPKGGGFSVHLPGVPKEKSQTAKTPIGDLKIRTATYATADGSVYLVSYTDFPPGAIKPDDHGRLIDSVRDALKGKDGKVVSEKEIAVGPEKGREVVIDKGKQQTRFRVVVRDHRLYQLAALGTGEFVTGKDATAFLDSFGFAK